MDSSRIVRHTRDRMSTATLSSETARSLGLDTKDEGDVCELFIRSKNSDGSVTVESDYHEAAPRRGKNKEQESSFGKAIRNREVYP